MPVAVLEDLKKHLLAGTYQEFLGLHPVCRATLADFEGFMRVDHLPPGQLGRNTYWLEGKHIADIEVIRDPGEVTLDTSGPDGFTVTLKPGRHGAAPTKRQRPIKYFELQAIEEPAELPPGVLRIATAAILSCDLCRRTIDGMGGPGHGAICPDCAALLRSGRLRGTVSYE